MSPSFCSVTTGFCSIGRNAGGRYSSYWGLSELSLARFCTMYFGQSPVSGRGAHPVDDKFPFGVTEVMHVVCLGDTVGPASHLSWLLDVPPGLVAGRLRRECAPEDFQRVRLDPF